MAERTIEWLEWWETPLAQRGPPPARDDAVRFHDISWKEWSNDEQKRIQQLVIRWIIAFCDLRNGLIPWHKPDPNTTRIIVGFFFDKEKAFVTLTEEDRLGTSNKIKQDVLSILQGHFSKLDDMLRLEPHLRPPWIEMPAEISRVYNLKRQYVEMCHPWIAYWDILLAEGRGKFPPTPARIPEEVRWTITFDDFPRADRRRLKLFYKRILPELGRDRGRTQFWVEKVEAADNPAQVRVELTYHRRDLPLVKTVNFYDPLSFLCGDVFPLHSAAKHRETHIGDISMKDVMREVYVDEIIRGPNCIMSKETYAEVAHAYITHWDKKQDYYPVADGVLGRFPARLGWDIQQGTDGFMALLDDDGEAKAEFVSRRPLAKNAKHAPEDMEAVGRFWDLMKAILPGAETVKTVVPSLSDMFTGETTPEKVKFFVVKVEHVTESLITARVLLKSRDSSLRVSVDVDFLEVISGGVVHDSLIESRVKDLLRFGRGETPLISATDDEDEVSAYRRLLGPDILEGSVWKYMFIPDKDKPLQRLAYMKHMQKRFSPVVGSLFDIQQGEDGADWALIDGENDQGQYIYKHPELREKIKKGHLRRIFRRAQEFDKAIPQLPPQVENLIFLMSDLGTPEREKMEEKRRRLATRSRPKGPGKTKAAPPAENVPRLRVAASQSSSGSGIQIEEVL